MVNERDELLRYFGNRIRTLRKNASYSQGKLAEICDLDRTYISGIERGIRNVSLKNIHAIATALSVSLEELFQGM